MFSRFKISDKDFSHKLYKCETIENITFEKCSFVMAKFIDCTFKNCEFIGCTFWGAEFENSPLDNAIITCSVGNGTDILNVIKRGWITITQKNINIDGVQWRHTGKPKITDTLEIIYKKDVNEPDWWVIHPDYSRVYEIIDETFFRK